MLVGFSLINHPFWVRVRYPIYGNPHMFVFFSICLGGNVGFWSISGWNGRLSLLHNTVGVKDNSDDVDLCKRETLLVDKADGCFKQFFPFFLQSRSPLVTMSVWISHKTHKIFEILADGFFEIWSNMPAIKNLPFSGSEACSPSYCWQASRS